MPKIGTRINGDVFYTYEVTKSKSKAQQTQTELKKMDKGNRIRITGPHYGYYFVRARHVSSKSINEKYKNIEIERVKAGDVWARKDEASWYRTLRYA